MDIVQKIGTLMKFAYHVTSLEIIGKKQPMITGRLEGKMMNHFFECLDCLEDLGFYVKSYCDVLDVKAKEGP